jgi:L-iditol 2-dehydrogenase
MIGLVKSAPGPGHLALTERPVPVPAAGQVAIEVTATGVCGTDLHIEAGEYATATPVTIGHEISGVVVELGPGVDSGWLGARVVCETFFSTCEECDACRAGRPNLCADRRSIGTHVDGGFASRVVVPACLLHLVPDWLDARAATLLEPLACVCQCLLDPVATAPGDRVLVTGPGAIGLLAGQLAKALGGMVTVAGLPHDGERLMVAELLGLEVIDGSDLPDDVDVAIEASGAGAGMEACLERVRKGGALVQVGIFGRPVTLSADQVLIKELSVYTGFASTPRSWRRAAALVERREVALEPLISEVSPLADWERVFAGLRAGRGVKAVLVPFIV